MPFNTYYEDELSYLRGLGAEFARANPLIAGYLSRDANDPDVERLLEGFAFLVARLRQKLEDEMPEIVHGLLRLVLPSYLRSVPPMTIVQFNPIPGAGDAVMTLPGGTMVKSSPVDNHPCQFQTCHEIKIMPLVIQRVEIDNRITSAKLTLRLGFQDRAGPAVFAQGRLRLFLNLDRDPGVGRSMLAFMLGHLRRLTVSTPDLDITLGPDQVSQGGMAREEAALPHPANAFSGFRLLQEYLAFPEKFLFVDIHGLQPLAEALSGPVTFTFEFDRPFAAPPREGEPWVHLNCVAMVNVFQADALPLRLDRSKVDYRVIPTDGASSSIHAIEAVSAVMQGVGLRQIPAFESMRHDLPGAPTANTTYFRERLRPATVGTGVEHYIAFVNRKDMPVDEEMSVASVRLLCTNGPLAHRLGIGLVNVPHPSTPSGLVFRNVTAVTRESPPPIGDAILWRLVSNLSRNFSTLCDVTALRAFIASYDFRSTYDAQARRRLELLLEGLVSFEAKTTNALIRSVPLRVRDVTLRAAESKIGGDGELFLLGAVMDRVLEAYSGINNLHRFSIEGVESNLRYRWPTRMGSASVI